MSDGNDFQDNQELDSLQNKHADDNSVIFIESDVEADSELIDSNRRANMNYHNRSNIPRDALNRFTNVNGTNTVVEILRHSDEHSAGNIPEQVIDDDVTIIEEHNLGNNQNYSILSNSEFVDLDNEPEYPSSLVNNTVVINHNQANTNDDDDDDEIVIVQERSTNPRIRLNLPGGETLEIDASQNDRPYRSSFEWQEAIPEPRRRALRRTARRANRLFFNPSDSESDGSNDYEEYMRTRAVRTEQGMRTIIRREARTPNALPLMTRIANNALLRRLFDHEGQSYRLKSVHPEMNAIKEQIEQFPYELRSAFDLSGNVQQFRVCIRDIDTSNIMSIFELIQLYTSYRAHLADGWIIGRVRTDGDEGYDNNQRTNFYNNREMINEHNRTVSRLSARHINDPNDFILRLNGNSTLDRNRAPGTEQEHLASVLFGLHRHTDNEAVETRRAIEMVQEREEIEYDRRVKMYTEKSRHQKESYDRKATALPGGYSASFSTEPKMKLKMFNNGVEETAFVTDDALVNSYEDMPACCLCGVELGVGIPSDYTGISQENRMISFESMVARYQFHCPYQTLLRPSPIDRELSKRTFIATCGHTYCGRCFARIDTAKGKSRMSKAKLKLLKGSAHPNNYGPKTCPATSCGTSLRSKGKMREAFL